jgi:iron-sulfur cluster insertion protein
MMQGVDQKIFRIKVKSGGCSGFSYQFLHENQTITDQDLQLPYSDFTVVIDNKSFAFLKGSELNYVREMIGSYFAVQNPNVSSSCGCGVSFSVL